MSEFKTWRAIIVAAGMAIGWDDRNAWLESMKDILADPLFVKDPSDNRLDGEFHIRPSSNPRRLGKYLVYYPDGSTTTLSSEDEIRTALLNYRMEKLKANL
jgi:hypothetical protein